MNRVLVRLLMLAEVALGAWCTYNMMYHLPATDLQAMAPDDQAQARHYLHGVPGLDDFMQTIIPFFRRAVATPLGKANWAVFLGSLLPLFVRMIEAASCKGAKGGVRYVFVLLLLSQVVGAGGILSACWFPLFALSEERIQSAVTSGSYVMSKGRIRAALVAIMVLLVNAMSFFLIQDGELWDKNAYIFQFALPCLALLVWPFKANGSVLSGVQHSEKSSHELQLVYGFTGGASYVMYIIAVGGFYLAKGVHYDGNIAELLMKDALAQPAPVKMLLVDHLSVSATIGAIVLVDSGFSALLKFLAASVFVSPGAAFAALNCGRVWRLRQQHNVRMEKLE